MSIELHPWMSGVWSRATHRALPCPPSSAISARYGTGGPFTPFAPVSRGRLASVGVHVKDVVVLPLWIISRVPVHDVDVNAITCFVGFLSSGTFWGQGNNHQSKYLYVIMFSLALSDSIYQGTWQNHATTWREIKQPKFWLNMILCCLTKVSTLFLIHWCSCPGF